MRKRDWYYKIIHFYCMKCFPLCCSPQHPATPCAAIFEHSR